MVRMGAVVLARNNAGLLCIGRDGSRMVCAPLDWYRGAMPPMPDADGDVAEIKATIAALLDRLCLRWPSYAVPRRLAVVTDGVGLGFAPEDPWPLGPGWLARQGQGTHGFTDLIFFDPQSAWSLMMRARPIC
jgi:hypothetical protein